MKFSIATSVLFLAGVINAAPASLEVRQTLSDNVEVTRRPTAKSSFTCGKVTYSGADIYNAIKQGVNLKRMGETRGKASYPHRFPYNTSKGVQLSFPQDCPANDQRQEYPLKDGGVYNGGQNNRKTSQERVIFYYIPGDVDAQGNPQATFCGLVTHTGAAKTGGFLQC